TDTWQLDTGGQTFGGSTDQLKVASHLSQQALHNSQPQARATDTCACRDAAGEGAQQALDIAFCNTGSLILDGNHQNIAVLMRRQLDARPIILRAASIATGIFDQVGDDTLQVVSADAGIQIGFDVSRQNPSQRFDMCAFAFVDVIEHSGNIVAMFGNSRSGTGSFHQLANTVFNLCNVLVNGGAGFVRYLA